MSEIQAKPRRRWFRFGLRTMFVVLTVVGLSFGWYWQIVNDVRNRKAFRQHAKDNYGRIPIPTPQFWFKRNVPRPDESESLKVFLAKVQAAQSPSMTGISGLRVWLGDEAVILVVAFGKEDRDLALLLFPEAHVYLHPWPVIE